MNTSQEQKIQHESIVASFEGPRALAHAAFGKAQMGGAYVFVIQLLPRRGFCSLKQMLHGFGSSTEGILKIENSCGGAMLRYCSQSFAHMSPRSSCSKHRVCLVSGPNKLKKQ